jgi:hypothetical protein
LALCIRSKLERRIRKILNTKVKKTINIWGKRLVVAALKGSFAIWLKKCGYINPICTRPKNTLEWVTDIEDFHGPQRRDDVITEASQIGVVQEMNQLYPDNFEYEEH